MNIDEDEKAVLESIAVMDHAISVRWLSLATAMERSLLQSLCQEKPDEAD